MHEFFTQPWLTGLVPVPALTRRDQPPIGATSKAESIGSSVFQDGPFEALTDIEFTTGGWVDSYNHRRLHGSLGTVSPERIRGRPLRGFHPKAAPLMGTAEDLRRFRHEIRISPGCDEGPPLDSKVTIEPLALPELLLSLGAWSELRGASHLPGPPPRGLSVSGVVSPS